jgi:hypothetical protein
MFRLQVFCWSWHVVTPLERPGNASHEHAGTPTTVSEGIWGHPLLPLSIGNISWFKFWYCLQIKGATNILWFLVIVSHKNVALWVNSMPRHQVYSHFRVALETIPFSLHGKVWQCHELLIAKSASTCCLSRKYIIVGLHNKGPSIVLVTAPFGGIPLCNLKPWSESIKQKMEVTRNKRWKIIQSREGMGVCLLNA